MNSTTPTISIEEASEVGPDVPEIPMSDEGQSALDMIGLGKPVNEKDYQIKHPYMEQLKEQETLKVLPKQGAAPVKPIGSSRVFQTTPHYDAAKAAQLAQADLAKRPYLPHMQTALPEASTETMAGGSGGGALPPTIPPPSMDDFQTPSGGGNEFAGGFSGNPDYDDLEQFNFGGDMSAPQDNSDKINGTGSAALSHFITKILLEDGYPAAMEFISRCDLQPYKNRNLPRDARSDLQNTVDKFNRRIEANSKIDRELIKEFRDALTACLVKWGIHSQVSPEGQLLYASIKIVSHGVKTASRNRRDMAMFKEEMLEKMDSFEKKYAEYLSALNHKNAA